MSDRRRDAEDHSAEHATKVAAVLGAFAIVGGALLRFTRPGQNFYSFRFDGLLVIASWAAWKMRDDDDERWLLLVLLGAVWLIVGVVTRWPFL